MAEIRSLLTYGFNILLIDDFNAHHTSRNYTHNKAYSIKMYDFLLHSDAGVICIGSFTRISDNSNSTIHFGLFKGFMLKTHESLQERSSNQNPFKVNIQI